MKLKNLMFCAGSAIILASCGDNSTTNTTTNDTTASSNATVGNSDNNTPGRTVEVPPATKASFETKYPNASNVQWTYYDEPYSGIDWEWTSWPAMDDKDYFVRYNWEGTDYYSWYDQDGNWIGSTAPVTNYASLPAAVNSAVSKEFIGYTITSVDKENDKDKEAYEIELEKGSDKAKALIAADGKILKKKGTMDGEKIEKQKADNK